MGQLYTSHERSAKPQCQILLNNEADSWKSAFYSLKIQINILRYIEPNELTIHDDELENKDMNKDI